MGGLTILDVVLRLLGAVGVGFVLGSQRARTAHPAGIRTHVLVSLGSCIVMIISCIMYTQTIEIFGTSPSDPARLGAQVICGIGFLGAGTILREGAIVKGLTTAASIWIVACLGLAVGMGYYIPTLLGTAAAYITLEVFERLQHRVYNKGRNRLEFILECEELGEIVFELKQLSKRYSAVIENLSFLRTTHNTFEITFRILFAVNCKPADVGEFQQELALLPGLIRMEHKTDKSF